MAVNSFDAGDLSPLFTTSVADPTTDPVLSFDLTAASPYTVFGNNTGSSADPVFFTPDLSTALFTGILPIASGGTGASVGAILNQTASPQTAGFNISGNGTIGGTLAVGSKVNIGSPSGTSGALNTNQDGIWSFRNSDPNRYIRFNTNGTFNDFLSTGVPLVINYGFAVAAQNVNFFGGSAAHLGIVSIGSNAATNARLNVKGSTANSSAYGLRLFDSSDVEKFSVRNDGLIALNGSAISLAGSLTTSGVNALTLTTTGATNITLPTSGTLATTSQLNSYVPYTGATTDVDLNGKKLSNSVRITASQFVVAGGLSSQFLKADGSLENKTFVELSGSTQSGDININGTIIAKNAGFNVTFGYGVISSATIGIALYGSASGSGGKGVYAGAAHGVAADIYNNSASYPTLQVVNDGVGPLAHFSSPGGVPITITGAGRISAGTIVSSDPSGGTGPEWKFGTYKSATVTLSTSNYVEIDIAGTVYKLGIVT